MVQAPETVYERRQPRGHVEDIQAIIDAYKPVAHRIKQIIDLLTPEGVQRVRNMEDGDEVDLNAAIDAMIAIRMGEQPNTRITMRNVLKTRDLSVVLLLDLSESTNEPMNGSEKTVLQLTREAATLVATAIEGIGDPFAIHGFASDGRHDVQYYRFKDFNQHFDDESKSRLAGMRGGLSTRMGAALRHAGTHLLKQQEKRKLILLVTDGEPADIDERDPQHLRQNPSSRVGRDMGHTPPKGGVPVSQPPERDSPGTGVPLSRLRLTIGNPPFVAEFLKIIFVPIQGSADAVTGLVQFFSDILRAHLPPPQGFHDTVLQRRILG